MKRMLILATALSLALALVACSVPEEGGESSLGSGDTNSVFLPEEGVDNTSTTTAQATQGGITGEQGADRTTARPSITTVANEVILPAGTSATTAGTTTAKPGVSTTPTQTEASPTQTSTSPTQSAVTPTQSRTSSTQSTAAPTQPPTTQKATTTSDDGKVHLPMIPA